jgi:hypothetical protein
MNEGLRVSEISHLWAYQAIKSKASSFDVVIKTGRLWFPPNHPLTQVVLTGHSTELSLVHDLEVQDRLQDCAEDVGSAV